LGTSSTQLNHPLRKMVDHRRSQTWLNVALAQKLFFSASSAVVAETATYPIGLFFPHYFDGRLLMVSQFLKIWWLPS
jgi:hypothetical protein